MTDKSKQAYAISMRDAYQPAIAVEIFFHRGSAVLQSQRSVSFYRRGWYWRDTQTGDWSGPFKSAEQADNDYFSA